MREVEEILSDNVGHRFEDLSRKIIGAAIEVHRELGPGFLENIYEEALKIELSEYDINYESQKDIDIEYLGVKIGLHRRKQNYYRIKGS